MGAVIVCILPFAFFCSSSLAFNPNWRIYQYGHRAWKIEDGFLGDLVNALAQDGDDYLWIGTNNGLFRFDGVSSSRDGNRGDEAGCQR